LCENCAHSTNASIQIIFPIYEYKHYQNHSRQEKAITLADTVHSTDGCQSFYLQTEAAAEMQRQREDGVPASIHHLLVRSQSS